MNKNYMEIKFLNTISVIDNFISDNELVRKMKAKLMVRLKDKIHTILLMLKMNLVRLQIQH